MRSVRIATASLLLVVLAAPLAAAQATEVPAFAPGAFKVFAHASADSMSVWMSTLEDDGTTPYYLTGAPTVPAVVATPALDPAVDEDFEARIALTPVLSQDLVLDGTINVQAYIGGGSATAGSASIATSLAIDGEVVASADAKDHTMQPHQAGSTYESITWTMSVSELAVPRDSVVEWIISGTVTAGNNVYLAAHEARGRSYIELPVVSTGTDPATLPEGEDNETVPPVSNQTTTPTGNVTGSPTTDPGQIGNETTTPLAGSGGEDGNATTSTPAGKKTPVPLWVAPAALGLTLAVRRRKETQNL